MFPIEAIKQARTYTLLADDLFTHLDILIEGTPYAQLRKDISLEFIYHYLYQNSYVPELRILYSEFCERLARLINRHARLPIFQEAEDLHSLVTPLLGEMDLLFRHIVINRWGEYTVEVNIDRFEISYVGDYRILKWSQSQDVKRFNTTDNVPIYNETSHSFQY